MLDLAQDTEIYRKDRNSYGGGVAVLIHKKLNPQQIYIETTCELVALKFCAPEEIELICVYRPPSTSICSFTKEMDEIINLFEGIQICIVGDINEGIFLLQNRTCCSMFKSKGLYQMVTKSTRHSGTLIDHVYATKTLQVKTVIL